MSLPIGRRIVSLGMLAGAGLGPGFVAPHRAPLSARQTEQAASAPSAPQGAPYDWPQMNGNPQHSGNNTSETVLGPSNVATLQFLYQVSLPAAADGAPVALAGVSTPGQSASVVRSIGAPSRS